MSRLNQGVKADESNSGLLLHITLVVHHTNIAIFQTELE